MRLDGKDWTKAHYQNGPGGRTIAMVKSDANTCALEMKQWVQTFCEERRWDPYHGAKDLAIGLVTEASELLELFRFVPEGEVREMMGREKDRQKIADELADSLYFILRIAQLYNFDVAECLQAKLKKNALKYPVPHQ